MNERILCPSRRRFIRNEDFSYPVSSFEPFPPSRIARGLYPSTSYATCHSTTACAGDDIADVQSMISTHTSENEPFAYENNNEELEEECCGCSASSESVRTEESKMPSVLTESAIESQQFDDYSKSYAASDNNFLSSKHFNEDSSKNTDFSGDKPNGLLSISQAKKNKFLYLPVLFLFYIVSFFCLLYWYMFYERQTKSDIASDEWGIIPDRCLELQYLIFSEYFC